MRTAEETALPSGRLTLVFSPCQIDSCYQNYFIQWLEVCNYVYKRLSKHKGGRVFTNNYGTSSPSIFEVVTCFLSLFLEISTKVTIHYIKAFENNKKRHQAQGSVTVIQTPSPLTSNHLNPNQKSISPQPEIKKLYLSRS